MYWRKLAHHHLLNICNTLKGCTTIFTCICYKQFNVRLLLQSSKEQLAEEAILLLTHQTIMDISVKWLNEESIF